MITEIGHFALILALAVALVQMIVPAYGAYIRDHRLMALADQAAVSQLALLAIAFLGLINAYVTSDFSVANVALNSHSTKPLIYKIAGAWGNHEGSMVLWVLILAVFGAAVALFGNNLPATLKANVLAVQASIAVAFLLFIVATSNPFARLAVAPLDGQGLNPILQDPALAFHPPFLYTGYVGFSMAFSFAIAALIEGRTDAAWARWVRPWTLAAWMCLTIGIAMGSWWAYYELGWGGWWFWDPVENASFMPWLAGTALLHSAVVMEKREALRVWTILLAILTFSLSLLGTFLVRSGVLTSVHAFAVDPARGVFVLLIMAIFTGGGLALFALRARDLKQGGLFAPISREGSLVLNNIILTTACATVLAGTLYPLVLESLTGAKISVGAPYFDMTFGPLMLPLLAALPFGPFLAWKRGDGLAAAQRLMFAAIAALVALAAAFALAGRGPHVAPFVIALGVWVMGGALSEIAFRAKLGSAPWPDVRRRLLNLPRSAFGTMLAHFGVGLMVAGIVSTSAYRSERVLVMKPGDKVEIAGYALNFRGAVPRQGPNYKEQVGAFEVTRDGAFVTKLEPAKRIYDAPPQPTTEAGIHASWRGDLYAVLGDAQGDGGTTVRLYFHPLVRFIWIGALIMFMGGAVSLSDRRLRVGAPNKRDTILNSGRGPVQLGTQLGIVSLSLFLALSPAHAVQPDEILTDVGLESRARSISAGLRCLICQNQSIDDSDAPLARDLRILVRERLQAGDTDAAVEAYVVARYGEYVLLKPPFGMHTLLLWFLPAFVLIGAIAAAMRSFGWGLGALPGSQSAPLSAEEEARLKELKEFEGHST